MLGFVVWMVLMGSADPPIDGCTVEVSGMPISVMRHHRLAVGADDERALEARVDLHLEGRAAQLQVIGPRYEGQRRLAAGECRDGAVVPLQATPRPARITFPCAPRGLTVACVRCPPSVGTRVHLAHDLPPMPMTGFTEEVELLLRAPGFQRQTRRVSLHPGPNTVRVQLEPLAAR